jgi:hypothetical protein
MNVNLLNSKRLVNHQFLSEQESIQNSSHAVTIHLEYQLALGFYDLQTTIAMLPFRTIKLCCLITKPEEDAGHISISAVNWTLKYHLVQRSQLHNYSSRRIKPTCS